jgi:S1-C subfamily serine protease
MSGRPAGRLRRAPSIASIHTELTQTDIFGRSVQGEAAGSGFVLSADGYIVTNNHVVEGADSITGTLDDGAIEGATLIAADPRSDLAVVHLERTDLVPLPIGDSAELQVGDPVVAIGNALDLGSEPTVTSGIVTAKDRTMIKPAQQLIDQLRVGEVPRHALLGVSTRPLSDGKAGAEISDVDPNSAVDTAGLEAGDVIVALDAKAITGPEDLVAAIAAHQPGDTVKIEISRDGRKQTVSAVLGAHDETNL